jgi:large subunit ribosomal protein L25
MKLSLSKRTGETKSEKSLIRHKGNIPAVIYSKGKQNHLVTINGIEFDAILREIQKGQLPTTVIHLEGEGLSCKAVVKDIQYEPTTYRVLHLDFLELQQEVPVNINVPIRFSGVADCPGIKLGGLLRQVIRHLKVNCLPSRMPKEFVLDVKDLGLKQTKRIKDIAMPEGVAPLAPVNEVVVVIAKR